MINRIKKLFNQWRTNRQFKREINHNIENLTDHTLIERMKNGL